VSYGLLPLTVLRTRFLLAKSTDSVEQAKGKTMARTGTVNISSITSLVDTPLNADYLLRVKERLTARGVEETPTEFKEEAAAMSYEAMDRAERAKSLKAAGQALIDEANSEMEEAEALANMNRDRITRRMGM
jgi:hypothetical protein